MKFLKYISWILLSLFLVTNIFSIGLFLENGDFTYYTNNPTPNINVTITSSKEPIYIKKASFTLNSEINEFDSFNDKTLLPSDLKRTFTFKLSDFNFDNLTSTDIARFNLFVTDLNDKKITPQGDPTNISIKYGNSIPKIINFENNQEQYLDVNNPNLDFIFSEEISKYEIYIGNNLKESYQNPSNLRSDFLTNFKINLSDKIIDGENSFKIIFQDIYGNEGELKLKIYYIEETLKITLLTVKEDPGLKYNYDSNLPELFEGKIYTKEDTFNLVVETSKEGSCYFSSSLLNFDLFSNLLNESRTLMTTTNRKIHTYPITTSFDRKIWVYCHSDLYSQDGEYLSESMNLGQSLIPIEKYQYSNLEIIEIIPETKVTYSPFDLIIKTDHNAICSYKTSLNSSYSNLTSDDLLSHKINLNLGNGVYSYDYSCFDAVNNIVTKSSTFEVNLNEGVQILNYTPKYSFSSSVSIKLQLTEDAEARYSLEEKNIQDYNTLTQISGSGLTREFTVNSLTKGENEIFIYFKKGNSIFIRRITIVYDEEGPRIHNIIFVNHGIESDYLGSNKKIKYKLNVTSLMPISKYDILVSRNDELKIKKTSTSESGSISGDFSNATNIKFTAIIEGGINTSSNKNLVFDFEDPGLSFEVNGNEIKLSCFDPISGCYRIYYGIAKTSISCNPNKRYHSNKTILIGENNYICAKAEDFVGNEVILREPITEGFNNNSGEGWIEDSDDDGVIDSEDNCLDVYNPLQEDLNGNGIGDICEDGDGTEVIHYGNETETNKSEIISEEVDDDLFGLNEEYLPEEDSGVNYLVILAIAFVLVGVSGGGYYAYKKGYLNKELEKLGIKVKSNNINKTNLGNYYSKTTPNKFSTQKIVPTNKVRGSTYDYHLDKLNKFIDGEINKGSSLFEKLKTKDKRKLNNRETLIKAKEQSSEDISQQDFDEFYSSSKDSKGKEKLTAKKEAESFEEFYKNKKKSANKINNKSKIKTKK